MSCRHSYLQGIPNSDNNFITTCTASYKLCKGVCTASYKLCKGVCTEKKEAWSPGKLVGPKTYN